jgi:hypothetical protein
MVEGSGLSMKEDTNQAKYPIKIFCGSRRGCEHLLQGVADSKAPSRLGSSATFGFGAPNITTQDLAFYQRSHTLPFLDVALLDTSMYIVSGMSRLQMFE